MKNVTIKQIAAKLNVEKSVAYGLVIGLEAMGLITKSGTVKSEPGKRGRSEHLYQISVETPTLVALRLDALLDADAPPVAQPVLETGANSVTEVPVEVSVDTPAEDEMPVIPSALSF